MYLVTLVLSFEHSIEVIPEDIKMIMKV